MLKLHGLVAAVHTPFHADGSLNLSVVEQQAAHLAKNGIIAAFVGGTTGECHSLSFEERRALAARWVDVRRGSALKVIVHVGSNCIGDAKALAIHAQQIGAFAVATLAPSYFKPRNVDALIDCCAEIASGAPDLPFYYYDIPSLTGVTLPMPEFLERGRARIPNLAGIKWTNSDLHSYQLCRSVAGDFDLPWGNDEYLLAGLALGAVGAVGSTYNFAAPLYHRIMKAFEANDMDSARAEQLRSARLVQIVASFGYMGAAKALMKLIGIDVGPARLPHTNPLVDQIDLMRQSLQAAGLSDGIA